MAVLLGNGVQTPESEESLRELVDGGDLVVRQAIHILPSEVGKLEDFVAGHLGISGGQEHRESREHGEEEEASHCKGYGVFCV